MAEKKLYTVSKNMHFEKYGYNQPTIKKREFLQELEMKIGKEIYVGGKMKCSDQNRL